MDSTGKLGIDCTNQPTNRSIHQTDIWCWIQIHQQPAKVLGKRTRDSKHAHDDDDDDDEQTSNIDKRPRLAAVHPADATEQSTSSSTTQDTASPTQPDSTTEIAPPDTTTTAGGASTSSKNPLKKIGVSIRKIVGSVVGRNKKKDSSTGGVDTDADAVDVDADDAQQQAE
jgi:hypothetical protein